MNIQCFHSSSAGNLYSISDGKTRIMLECGVVFKEIQRCFDFKLSELAGCVITHEHGDHSKSWDKVSKYTPVYMLEETAKALGAKGYNIKHYTPNKALNLGTFTILPIAAQHDVPCCYFDIYSTETQERVLFVTDTATVSKIAFNTHYAMIECNYILETLNEAVDKGVLNSAARNRVLSSHMGLHTTESILRGLNPNTLKEVHILHISNRHGDAETIKKNIMRLTGKPVYIAEE